MTPTPYLFFSGNGREAMTRYQEILGGELELMTFGDMPADEEPPPFEVDPDGMMHGALTFDDGGMIMGSDDPTGDGSGVSGMAISIDLPDAAEVRRVFDALADGGEIGMPLGETFWSPLFGTCTDRFGVTWMVSVAAEPPAA
jgi:PhnB protein